MDNFTPEMFCKIRPEQKLNKNRLIEKKPDYDNETKKPEPDYFFESKPEPVHRDYSMYLLASAASTIVAVVMYIFFGANSLKFSGLTFAAYITS